MQGNSSDTIVCRLCNKTYTQPRTLYKHLRTVHSTGPPSKGNLICPLCGIHSTRYETHRDHLLYCHGQRTEGEKLEFESFTAFLVWKNELESQLDCKYVCHSGPKVLSTKDKKYYYKCRNSDIFSPRSFGKRKKEQNTYIESACPSMISVVECHDSLTVKAEHWSTHKHISSYTRPTVASKLMMADELYAAIDAIGDKSNDLDSNSEEENTPNIKLVGKSPSVTPNRSLQPSTITSTLCTTTPINSSSVQKSVATTKMNTPMGTVSKIHSTSKQSIEKSTVSGNARKTFGSSLYSLASVACSKDTSLNINKSLLHNQTSTTAISTASVKNTPGLKQSISRIAVQDSLILEGNNKIQISGSPVDPQMPYDNRTNNRALKEKDSLSLQSSSKPILTVNTNSSTAAMPSAGQVLLINTLPRNQMVQTTGNIVGEVPKSKAPMNMIGVNRPPVSQILFSSVSMPSTYVPASNSICALSGATGTTVLTSMQTGINPKYRSQMGQVFFTTVPVNKSVAKQMSGIKVPSTPLSSPVSINTSVTPIMTSQLFTDAVSHSSKPVIIEKTVCSTTSSSLPISIVANSVKSLASTNTMVCKTSSDVPINVLTGSTMCGNNQAPVSTVPINLVPISSTPTITIPSLPDHLGMPNSGTLLLQDSGNIYLLEPVENSTATSTTLPKSVLPKQLQNKVTAPYPTSMENRAEVTPVIMPTIETSRNSKSVHSDCEILKKIECYKLEMKYLACQEECKKLKLQLLKAEIKNKEILKESNPDFDMQSKAEEFLQRNDCTNYLKEKVKEWKAKGPVSKPCEKSQDVIKNLESKFGCDKDPDVYSLIRTSVLRNLHAEVWDLSEENKQLFEEIQSYRKHDKFYKMLQTKIIEEEF